MPPIVTVIIPNFNHGRFLERRINSVLQQHWANFEVILLDDASTDNSREIMESYRTHPQVKDIVYNDTNCGSPFKQWHRGIQLAAADWIWIAESDDYCDPGFLEALSPAFTRPDCVLAYSEIDWVDERGEILKAAVSSNARWMGGIEFLKQHMLMEDHLVNAGMVVFRKECAHKVSPQWLSMKQAGDYWFWSEISRQGNVFACGKPLAFFVRHPQSVSAALLNTECHWMEHLEVLDNLVAHKVLLPRDLKAFGMEKLIGLETQRRALETNLYLQWRTFWLRQLDKRHLPASAKVIVLRAWQRKFNHLFKTHLTALR